MIKSITFLLQLQAIILLQQFANCTTTLLRHHLPKIPITCRRYHGSKIFMKQQSTSHPKKSTCTISLLLM
jgi:hypothetical protein